MLPLPSTKYPTTQRTVTGVTDVYADDVVLNCDTSAGPITINLGEIPNNFFSTQYKLYVVDTANNAGVNNITINAGAGQTINNQASFTVNISGSSTLLLITGNASYVALGNGVSTIPNFITVTYAQLTALVTGNLIKPNGDYLLLDAEFGSAPFLTPTNVYLKGMTINKTADIYTDAIFYDADYQAIGNYSSITGFAGQLGIWRPVLVTPLNSVVIWNNRHYLNTSGVNGLVNPTSDIANWTVLPISITNGYIQVINTTSYNYSNNRIVGRIDLSGNVVERTIFGGVNSLNVFGWGNANIRQNQVLGNSIFNNCNNIYQNPCFNNRLNNQSRVNFSQTNTTPTLENFVGNIFENSILNLPVGASEFNNNLIYSSTINFTGLGSDKTNNNLIKNSTLNLTSQNDILSNNEIVGSIFNITVQNSGQIIDNVINNSTFSIEQNIGPTSLISQNKLYQGSFMTLKDNSGTIQKNTISQDSTFTLVTTNTFGSFVQFVTISDRSALTIDTNNGTLGAKGGIIIDGVSSITVTTNSSLISNLTVIDSSIFDVVTCSDQVEKVTLQQDTSLSIRTIFAGSGGIASLLLNGGSVGLSGTYDLVVGSTTLQGVRMPGNSTVKRVLDCSDLSIYNPGTQTLTINPDIQEMLGVIELTNAGGITITEIAGLTTAFPIKIFNDNGITTFNSVALAGPPALNGIVSQNGNFAYLVKYNANCRDFIVLTKETGGLNIVQNAVIIT